MALMRQRRVARTQDSVGRHGYTRLLDVAEDAETFSLRCGVGVAVGTRIVSVISQFDGPMIKVGDGCRAIETLEMAQKTA